MRGARISASAYLAARTPSISLTTDGETRIFVMPYSEEEDDACAANGVEVGSKPVPRVQRKRKRRSMWQLTFPTTLERAMELSAGGSECLLREALKRCGGWHAPVPEMLKGYPVYDRNVLTLAPSLMVRCDSVAQCPESSAPGIDSGVVGNECDNVRVVTLCGDAAHPMSPLKGQGANQALLDAVCFAEQLPTFQSCRQWALEPRTKPRRRRKNKRAAATTHTRVRQEERTCDGSAGESTLSVAETTLRRVAVAMREYEREMVARSTPKVQVRDIRSNPSCVALHDRAMLDPSFHARRKSLGGTDREDARLATVCRMRDAGIGAEAVASGELDRMAFVPPTCGELTANTDIASYGAERSKAAAAVPCHKNKSTGAWGQGVIEVEMCLLAELVKHPRLVMLRRVIVTQAAAAAVDCQGAMLVKKLRTAFNEVCGTKNDALPVVVLPPSGWSGVVRNVPVARRIPQSDPPSICAVAVFSTYSGRIKDKGRGRVLVLTNIKYRGNLGTIVRSAVQSNVFEAVWIVDDPAPLGLEGETSVDVPIHDGVSKRGATDDELNWYSLQNAPLIAIERFSSSSAFLQHLVLQDGQRKMVAVELGETSLNLYSEAASTALSAQDLLLVVGAEDTGVPEEILAQCDAMVELPSLSASVNVSCAFAAVLAVLQMADTQQRRRAASKEFH